MYLVSISLTHIMFYPALETVSHIVLDNTTNQVDIYLIYLCIYIYVHLDISIHYMYLVSISLTHITF